MAVLRTVAAFLVALVAATGAGSVFASLMIQAGLVGAGATFTPADRLAAIGEDYSGLVVGTLFRNGVPGAYVLVFAIGLAVGFVVAFGLKRLVKPLAPVAYPLAGAAAIATALMLMSLQYYGTTPIAGARGSLGFALQLAAGAIGGLVFALLRPKRG